MKIKNIKSKQVINVEQIQFCGTHLNYLDANQYQCI